MSAHRHATCVVVGEAGILLLGPAGAGKSTLARRIVEAAARGGRFARIVGDDRVSLVAEAGRVVARGHPVLAGTLEARGIGLLPCAHEAAAVVRLVVDVGGRPAARLPEPAELTTDVAGVRLPRLQASDAQADRVLLCLDATVGGGEGNRVAGTAL